MVEHEHIQLSVYQKAKKGKYYCGDSYYFKETEDEFICALADGLGSGEEAKESSQAVMDIIEDNESATVEKLIKLCNKELIGKRGVVLGVLKINFSKKTYTFSSIGNIGIMTISADSEKKRNIPQNGYLGSYPRQLKVVHENFSEDMVFVMFSDGVTSKDLSYKFFLEKDVTKITELFSHSLDQNRHDDTTLIVMRYNL